MKSRDTAVKNFREKEDIKILLATMKTGGIGINLTMANKCIIYDRWWNEGTEEQVSDIVGLKRSII